MKQARSDPQNTVMLFEDEASFYSQPTQASLFARRGKMQPTVPLSTGTQKRVVAIAALNAVTGQTHMELVDKASVEALKAFLAGLLSYYSDKATVILSMDNWLVHYNAALLAFYKSQPRLHIKPLPTYSPWLNPIEKVWRRTKQQRVHAHKMSQNFKELKQSLIKQIETFNQNPEQTLRYVGLAPP